MCLLQLAGGLEGHTGDFPMSHTLLHMLPCVPDYMYKLDNFLCIELRFNSREIFEHLEQSSKTDMVALINDCAGQGNLAGIQGMVFEIWHTQNLSKEEHLMQEILKIHR